MSSIVLAAPKKMIELSVDGQPVRVFEGSTILDACRMLGNEQPTLCYGDTLTPVNVCRVCVVEVEGARTLVPSCSRIAEAGMVVHTDSERVRTSRRLVLELLGSSVDLSTAPEALAYIEEYDAKPDRFGPDAATVAQDVKIDNDLYVRDYSKCILCYKCVSACGEDHQNTFAIAVAGRGFDAHISTELDVTLPESACVYCGNCIAVCPDWRADVGCRVREAAGRHVGRRERDGRLDGVPVLRRRLQPRAARAGQRDRQRHLAARPRRDGGQPLHQGTVRLPVRAESPLMQVRVLYWQEIPSLIRVTADDGAQLSRQLPDSFQQEIDRVAMEQGLVGSDAYLEQFVWHELDPRDGAPNDVLDAVEAELVANRDA